MHLQGSCLYADVTDRVQSCIYFINNTVRIYTKICIFLRGPGSSVGIATELRAGRSGDRIPVGRDFPHPSRLVLRLTSLLYNGYRVFSGGKVRPGRAADHSPPSSAMVMEE